MTDLPARIKPLASGFAGQIPAAGDLERGELALNTADRLLYTKHGDDAVYEVGRAKLVQLSDYSGTNIPTADSVLIYDYTTGTWKDSQDWINLTDLKAVVAASTDFADFKSRIAAL